MITYRSRFLTRSEVWFDEEPDNTRSVDWILYHQRSRTVPGAKCKYFYTYLVDLSQSREYLLAQLNEDTAYKIRRARDRDKIICECCDPNDPAVIDRFEEIYNPFAASKGLRPLERERIDSMASTGALDLSAAKDSQGNVLVYHANYRTQHRATELHLPSLYRKLANSAARNVIGRANRYLTWSDILRYQEQGLKYFDFGGWYPGTTDQALLKINEFKRGFGGQIMREYRCERILTLKGWLVLRVAGLLKQIKLFPSGSKKPAADSAPAAVQNPAAAASA
jgi:hypothetical protein